MRRRTFVLLYTLGFLLISFESAGLCDPYDRAGLSDVTILCYMNGDNELAQEVLYALDTMETVGSSNEVNVIALVDGHPQWLGPYDAVWSQTRLLHLQADAHIGHITSPVLEEWGEADLGDPQTLSRFVRTALMRYPARHYIFYTFAHGQGVINTRSYGSPQPAKTISMSRDDTSGGRALTLSQFHQAIKSGLSGRRFDMMVLFSCLANMVEINYTLSDVTRYVVGSQDEIRLVNQPSGRHQIRGLRFEELISRIKETSAADMQALGRVLVDSHVDDYEQELHLAFGSGSGQVCSFAGDMTMVNSAAIPHLVLSLDQLARQLIAHRKDPDVLQAIKSTLSTTQSFPSFLNLEYYDLQEFLSHLNAGIRRPALESACKQVLDIISERIVVYGRHTPACAANGISIYFSHPLVPDNIFLAHQALYQRNRFCRDTYWDEMIQALRPELKKVMAAASSPPPGIKKGANP